MKKILFILFWLTHFIEILLVLEFQLIKFIVGLFSYKAHFRPHIPLMYAFLSFKLTFSHRRSFTKEFLTIDLLDRRM